MLLLTAVERKCIPHPPPPTLDTRFRSHVTELATVSERSADQTPQIKMFSFLKSFTGPLQETHSLFETPINPYPPGLAC